MVRSFKVFNSLVLTLGFSKINVAIFICYVGVISALSQTVVLSNLIKRIGAKKSILIGLTAQFIQLVWYGLSTATWAVWTAGIFVSFSSISYAAISAYLSLDTDKDNQVQREVMERVNYQYNLFREQYREL